MSTIANTISKRVGRAVKARREELRLTLRALALRSGISSSMICCRPDILDVAPLKPPVTGLVGNGRRSPARVCRMVAI